MAAPKNITQKTGGSSKPAKSKPPRNWDLMDAIRNEKDYKSNVTRRDKNSRKYIEENYTPKRKTSIFPGQLVMFHYFEPATKDQLQYYDAMPCTIFFGTVNTENGPRVIGFNIHYYPPRIRFQVMERIFEIFKPIYLKSWSEPLKAEMDFFNYKMFVQQLQKAKLDFGIREYIPNLIAHVMPIPLESWSKAVLTEGVFKKETRTQILKYWKDKADGISKPGAKKVTVNSKGKKTNKKAK